MKPFPVLGYCMLAGWPVIGAGQNRVPNGSFEDYSSCPDALSQIGHATEWFSAWGTVDYFNTCSPVNSPPAVPHSAMGFQTPASGQGYMGLVTYLAPGTAPDPDHSKEIALAQLDAPLVPGVPVFLSFKFAVAAGGTQVTSSPRWSCNKFGMRFGMTTAYDGLSPHANNAVLSVPLTPTDTLAWQTVSGSFIPDSAYAVLFIGNFFADSLLLPVLIDATASWERAYVFIDDVCVSTSSTECDQADHESDISAQDFLLWPNPAAEVLYVRLERSSQPVDYCLYDTVGRPVKKGLTHRSGGTHTISTGGLVNGLYHLRLFSSAGDFSIAVMINNN